MHTLRTSQTHPLEIAFVFADGIPGPIGLTFCPGKKQPASGSGGWNRDLATDLDVIAASAQTLVTLVESQELAELGVPQLGREAAARGLEWHHLPIRDYQVPDERFESGWTTVGSAVRRRLRTGEAVVFHCKGGLGRAGLTAARVLIELGTPADEAIRRVRAARPGAIETAAQEAFVRARQPVREAGIDTAGA